MTIKATPDDMRKLRNAEMGLRKNLGSLDTADYIRQVADAVESCGHIQPLTCCYPFKSEKI